MLSIIQYLALHKLRVHWYPKSSLIIGATNPTNAAMGTIRGDFGQVSGRNVVHGADSVSSASREIALWFSDTEIMEWDSCLNPWIHDH